MKRSTKPILRAVSVTLLIVCSTLSVFAQKMVTGKVTHANTGEPLAGVTVTVKGTSTSVQTSATGDYRIEAPSTSSILQFTSIGFATVEVSAATAGNISMQINSEQLEDIVVVAYGTRKKTDLTGSVTAVTAADFQKGNIASTEQLLVGKVSGLEVTTGGGSAGGGSRIRIRGTSSLNASNDPLIVVDGIPVEGNGISGSANLLNTINPDDIESISVLKDASATALYGSRASNGVLIITTKKGKRGKMTFNFNTKLSLSQVGETVDVLSGDEIRSVINADAAATGINTFKDLLGTENTNWQDLIYQNAFGTDNNISLSGGIGSGNFVLPIRASLGYLKQEGVLKTNNFDRVSASINLSPKFLDDHLSVTVAAKYAHTKNRFADEGAIGTAVGFDPTQPVYEAGSKWGGYFQWLQNDGKPINTNGGSIAPNPLDLLYLRNNNSDVNRFIGNVQLDYKLHFLPDLHVLLNVGVDQINGKGNDIIDSTSVTNWHTNGRVSEYKQGKKNSLIDASLFYTKTINDDFQFDVLAGHSYQAFETDVYNFASYGQDATVIPSSVPTFDTDHPEYRLESYLGRVNMTILNKYLLTGSIRRDASSKFSKDHRVGYFPSAALAWKMNEEFFPSASGINELKLRLGWGVTGQQDGIDYYSYLSRYTSSQNVGAQYQFGNTFYTFLRPSAYDAALKWETTTTTNIGLDFGFLNNRINGSIDVYQKKTEDLLSVVPIAPGANFDIQLLTNVGNMENKGVEFTLNTVPVQKENYSWDLGFNITYNKAEITNLLKNPDPNFIGIDQSGVAGGTNNYIGKYAIGYAPFVYYTYKQVYDEAGKPIEGLYEDLNRDGKIDAGDRYFYKKPAADVMLGLYTAFNYKNFTLGIAGHGAFGNYLYNNFNSNGATLVNIKDPLNVIRNAGVNYNETNFKLRNLLSDYYIENASFFRIDNINLGYNFGSVFNNSARLRVSASIQNVATFTNYSGLDPESSNSTGVDNTIYPRPTIYSVGASIDF